MYRSGNAKSGWLVDRPLSIAHISAAKPKIADYPFTTLIPNLGVVDAGEYKHFVIADIPGLIEGAHNGAGLGLQFLRHVERTKLFLHVIDVSGVAPHSPLECYRIINEELQSYRAELATRPQIIVANKIDALDEAAKLTELREFCQQNDLPFYAISAVTGEGLKILVSAIVEKLDQLSHAALVAHENTFLSQTGRDLDN